MEVAVRSYLAAGVAVVGATSIALAPVEVLPPDFQIRGDRMVAVLEEVSLSSLADLIAAAQSGWAPIGGAVAARMVNEGDYVGVGTPIVRLSTDQLLRITLPYPESLADVLRPGLPVRLRSPAAPDAVVEGTVSEIRPTVGVSNRALLVLVDLPNPGGWKPGASVDGEVILDRRQQALTVPETAVVLRPAGPTVYVIDKDRAHAAVVRPGVYRDGRVEILSGIEAGARVAVDGAGFLSDGAAVRVQDGGA
jgi:RND family efflux transporter MFP subunit